jgi:uncharacterized SAM-binding protein YcdF (DUF218 family)
MKFGVFQGRLFRRALLALGCALVIFAALTARLFIWPAQGVPGQVSAIIMFAGYDDRLSVALMLAKEGRAPVLVVSQGHDGYGGSCPPPVGRVRVICFDPVPSDTRGEAEFGAALARRYHWSSVALVTGRAQDTRARMLMARCFNGPVYVATASVAWHNWPAEIAYEWGALLKALLVQRTC